ncbi:MAG TPA: alternative ribosome rescue aminoacyl-tRNA hydrolase ArfB [Polyangiaceae bacterium]|jgi:ribosome-associated protein|nr:alternative ribosome rescue aminoacyl-tRNA hydrolase ArfB [Polyangiaceae bacterium]
MPLVVAPDWLVPDDELQVSYVRSSGPGGQNVNKVSTKVELRFSYQSSTALSEKQKQRLARSFPAHVTLGGEFVLSSDRFRSQSRNLADALTRLAEMLIAVRREPRRRIATKPSAAAKKRRVAGKRKRAAVKEYRHFRQDD